jgi:ribosomal protein S18 acetylase RimI-like enzyme
MAGIDNRIKFRDAREGDVEALAELVARLKRLNEEFDSMLKVRDDIKDVSRSYISSAVKDKNCIVLVAENDGKVVGLLKADIRERRFSQPMTEGRIIEFYIMPEYRKHGGGTEMLHHAIDRMKRIGVKIVSAEFPSQNKISVEFYAKQGFRPITNIHAKLI